LDIIQRELTLEALFMGSPLLFTIATLAVLIVPAAAGKTVDRDSLIAVPVEIHNSGTAPILCQAEIAHWFATDLATIAPGDSASLDLRFDPVSSTWATMNTRGEALPLERAWCGVEGRTYETRWDIQLDRDEPQAKRLDCRREGAGLGCR
jgi:hypothetical protein